MGHYSPAQVRGVLRHPHHRHAARIKKPSHTVTWLMKISLYLINIIITYRTGDKDKHHREKTELPCQFRSFALFRKITARGKLFGLPTGPGLTLDRVSAFSYF
jgi:hypothetical protein